MVGDIIAGLTPSVALQFLLELCSSLETFDLNTFEEVMIRAHKRKQYAAVTHLFSVLTEKLQWKPTISMVNMYLEVLVFQGQYTKAKRFFETLYSTRDKSVYNFRTVEIMFEGLIAAKEPYSAFKAFRILEQHPESSFYLGTTHLEKLLRLKLDLGHIASGYAIFQRIKAMLNRRSPTTSSLDSLTFSNCHEMIDFYAQENNFPMMEAIFNAMLHLSYHPRDIHLRPRKETYNLMITHAPNIVTRQDYISLCNMYEIPEWNA